MPLAQALALLVPLSGCGLFGGGGGNAKLGVTPPPKPVFGFAVAPDPEAAIAARHVLLEGGNAVDAATAAGFVLAVTLPSRAGLGGGGACLIYAPHNATSPTPKPVSLLFLPRAAANAAGADRPAAVPEMARGLIAMQARYGQLSLAADMAPAETLAGGGAPVSRALAADLRVVGGALTADPAAAAVFAPSGSLLGPGQIMRQPDLAATLGALQTGGALDLVQGSLASQFVAAADQAGGGLDLADLRRAAPRYAPPLTMTHGGISLAFLPPPAYGGTGAMAGFRALAANPQDLNAAAQAAASASFAAEGVKTAPAALPASTGFAALDGQGGIVACATTMNNLFGTGRIAPGTGILLAASPAHVPPPLLAAGIAYRGGKFRAAATGSGQQGAPMAVADALYNALGSGRPMPSPVPQPGRANVIACSGFMPGDPKSCAAAADPRGFGLATGSP
ncbi:MAG TPA: gamma-glutamyltransferase [Acetobacteraceae bacterium]|nr:gamma-glutamyltransferase [Acetobacteraceae bacterium]